LERNLEGRVAIITGGAGAIGSAASERLARAGATMAIADKNGAAAAKLAAALTGEGLSAKAFEVDLASEAEILKLVSDVVQTFGRVDILLNNAAHNVIDDDLTLLEINSTIWDQAFAVNVRAAMLMSQAVVRQMLEQGTGGVIVNTSSGAAEMPAIDARTAYGPSKAALNVLTQYVAMQYGGKNIRCNAILPGVIFTPGMQKLFTQEQLDGMISATMLQRMNYPDDVAAMMHFLVSDDARQVTGQLIRVDGGRP
jgi:NAD(P)-dependent dehydrogenase (short-subunit alcohol dehydrogenase family)